MVGGFARTQGLGVTVTVDPSMGLDGPVSCSISGGCSMKLGAGLTDLDCSVGLSIISSNAGPYELATTGRVVIHYRP